MYMTMRDILIQEIYHRMKVDDNVFFLTADFGSPALDKIRKDFSDNWINVGIAEADLINISCGLTMEGFDVFAYGISAFLSMRCFEQIRNNLAIMGQIKDLNINLISVGSGLSYDISGPSHGCLEDLSIMRTLPNIDIISPSDNIIIQKLVEYTLKIKRPKYIRLDSKTLPNIYNENMNIKIEDGFYELKKGNDVCLISTGFMTHTSLKVTESEYIEKYFFNKIGHIDIFMLRPLDENKLFNKLKDYKTIITLEEGFIGKGGLDSLISKILRKNNSDIKLKAIGLEDRYEFKIGKREYLHKLNGLDTDNIIRIINAV